MTSSSELFVDVAALAARMLGLPGEDPRALSAARDKSGQRRRFATCGVASPRHRTETTVAGAVAAALAIGLPVVLKPPTRSGSLGVRRCTTAAAVAAHAGHLLATTVDERGRRLPARLLVEEYLAGPEFSVELLAGRARAVVGKHVDESRGFLETGHDLPADVDAATAAALRDTACAAAAALGLTWGAVHVELRVIDGRPVVVEANPRLAGGMIPEAVRAVTGVDLIAELIARTTGRPGPAPTAPLGAAASVRFVLAPGDGTVRTVPDAASVRTLDGVVAAGVTARPGQQIIRQGTFLDRLGYVVACGAEAGDAAARAAFAAQLLAPDVEPDRTAVNAP